MSAFAHSLVLPCPPKRLLLRRRKYTSPAVSASASPQQPAPPKLRKRTRYRKRYPGESEGITEEMRFVAMRLRNSDGKKINDAVGVEMDPSREDGDTWKPSMEGFVSYLVDSEAVFNAVERIVDHSNDVAYAYFRKTGLERSEGLLKDLEYFRGKGIEIPEAGNPGLTYTKYLEELGEKSAPLFLSHFYNIYFSHIAAGQVILKQVSASLLDGAELEFYRWDGHVPELLKQVRGNLNMLGEHWSRDEKNKCLKETAKSFKFLGQIVRLIIL